MPCLKATATSQVNSCGGLSVMSTYHVAEGVADPLRNVLQGLPLPLQPPRSLDFGPRMFMRLEEAFNDDRCLLGCLRVERHSEVGARKWEGSAGRLGHSRGQQVLHNVRLSALYPSNWSSRCALCGLERHAAWALCALKIVNVDMAREFHSPISPGTSARSSSAVGLA